MKYVQPLVTVGIFAVATNLAACGGGGSSAGTQPPAMTYTLGGTIGGLTGSGMILSDGEQPSPQTFSPERPLTAFTFGGASGAVNAGTAYSVTIQLQPTGNRCTVTNGTGTVSANVSNITVSCVSPTISILANPADYANAAQTTTDSFGAQSIAVDTTGNVYAVDTWTRHLLKITPAASVTSMALADAATGAPISQYTADQVAVDAAGTLYLAAIPFGGTGVVIQKVTPAGEVTTLAGSGTLGATDATGAAASFSDWVKGLAVDTSGNIYVADYGSGTLSAPNNRIRKVTPAGVVSTLAGSGAQGAANGAGLSASFDLGGATGNVLAADHSGNIYVVEWPNDDVREITPAGVVSTIAGGGGRFGGTDGPGVTVASFANPTGIAVDSGGNIYILDGSNSIRLIMANDSVSTLVSGGTIYDSGNNVVSVGVSALTSIACSADGTLYTAGADNVNSNFSADVHKISFK